MIADPHINAAHNQDIRHINKSQIPGFMLGQKHINSKRKCQEKQHDKNQETEKLLCPARHIKAVIQTASAPGRRMIFPELCLHAGKQLLVVLMKLGSLLRNALLHALILGLFPLCPGFF